MTVTHYRILAVAWTIGVVIAYSLPDPGLPVETQIQLDKAAHFGMFLGFGFLWMHALHPRRNGQKHLSMMRALLLLTVGAALSLGAEFYQGMLPRRATELMDGLANMLGLLTAVGFFYWRHPPKRTRAVS